MDIKEIREVLDKLDKEKTYSDAFVGACLSCYLSSEEQDEAINKAKQEYENNKVSSDLHASFPSYCRFLLSEVEGLQNTIAQMQDVEQTIYECRMKGGDAVRHLLDSLLAENKQLKTEVERLEKDVKGLSENLFISNEGAVKLEKENATLRKVVEAARDFEKEMHGVKVLMKEHPGYLEKCFRLIKAIKKIKEGL